MIWVTSDLHLNHPGILETCRKFSDINEHNEYIIKQYNSVVDKDDLVYILGDVGFTPMKDLSPLIQRLNGRKVLVLGNHDKGTEGEYRKMGFIDVKDSPFYYSSSIILSHEPAYEAFNNPYVYNIYGHLHQAVVDLPNYINANVELCDYKPISLRELQEKIKNEVKSRREKFGEEWYFPYYKQVFKENN